MYKRRDWIFTHNPDTGAISSDSDGESEDAGDSEAAASDSDDLTDGASEDESEVEEEAKQSMEQLQDMLEDSDDEGDAQPREQLLKAPRSRSQATGGGKTASFELEDQKMAWLQAEGSERPKGVPLRCLLCKDKLLVSADVFRQHLTSKAHITSAKRRGIQDDQLKQLDSIVEASSVRPQAAEGTETHAQRLQRFQQIKQALDMQSGSQKRARKPSTPCKASSQWNQRCKQEGSESQGAQQQGEGTAGQSGEKHGRKEKSAGVKRKGKPGKRQRQALKAAAAATGTSSGQACGTQA